LAVRLNSGVEQIQEPHHMKFPAPSRPAYRVACPLIIITMLAVSIAKAATVGEIHRVTDSPNAHLRDAERRSQLRITVWYPAASDAVERAVSIGPPDKPLFNVGAAAPNAPFAQDEVRLPVILLSHGFGGTARMMGWFGIAMAREGYVVVAVDHPGNNGIDKMTVAGARLWWNRADDLRAALNAMAKDTIIGPHLDLSRVGVAGFSAGGFTALVASGARVEPARLRKFCAANPSDGVCQPQLEFVVTPTEVEAELKRPEIAAEVARATADHSIPQVRAAFAIAPAIVQALEPSSLSRMRTPVEIFLGDADTVAPPATNGLVAAKAIPNSSLIRLPGVRHYDFLSSCTEHGRAMVALCKSNFMQTETHRKTIDAAKNFFHHQLGAPIDSLPAP
jgi:predicted dienelactone hydrolase